jgi:hypothetical protein
LLAEEREQFALIRAAGLWSEVTEWLRACQEPKYSHLVRKTAIPSMERFFMKRDRGNRTVNEELVTIRS